MVAAVAAVFLKFAAIFFTDGAKPDFNTAVTGLTRLSSFHQKPPRTPKNIIYPFLSRPSVRWWRFGGEKSCLNIPANLNSSIRQLFIESR